MMMMMKTTTKMMIMMMMMIIMRRRMRMMMMMMMMVRWWWNLPDTAPQILDCHAHTGWPCSHDHALYKNINHKKMKIIHQN